MLPVESILDTPSPNAPDLGCFVRRKHDFQIDPEVDFENAHLEFNPSIDFNPPYHQTYFRVMCGHAAFFQRCLVYMTTDLTIPPPVLQTFPPDWILGGDYPARPSEWFRYPTQAGERFYWFFGQCRNPSSSSWDVDTLVGHSYDIYENGTLSIVRYDDTGGDRDFNDLILEVAIVGRTSWQRLVQARDQAAVNAKIKEAGLPKVRALLQRRKS